MITKLRKDMERRRLDALVICDPDSVFYLTGCRIDPGERMYVLLVTPQKSELVLPKMFTEEAGSADAEVHRTFFQDTDPYIDMVTDILSALSPQYEDNLRIGADKLLVAKFLLPMMKKMPGASFVDGSEGIDFIRMHKTAEECEKMKISSLLNDKIIGEFAGFLALPSSLGISEKDGAKKLLEIAEKNGVEGISFEPIVSFGAGTAQPHHEPASDVFLEINCPVILDIGFVKNGYCSDMTRSFFRTENGMEIGDASSTNREKERFNEIYNIVKKANLAGIAKVAPGVPLSEVDAAARNLIREEGYGEYFTHRLGHGIGIAVHEFPDVSAASSAICAEGMIFSIEPGIYHMESGIGVRIEDLVLVTKDGCEVLNRFPK